MKFAPNKPIETREAAVAVDPGLPAGKYIFQLVVVNERGRQSQPARATVSIVRERPSNLPVPPPLHRVAYEP